MIFERQFFLNEYDDIYGIIKQIKEDPHYNKSSSILIKDLSPKIPYEISVRHNNILNQELKNCQIFGLAINNRDGDFNDYRGKIRAIFFETSYIKVISLQCEDNDFESLAKKIKADLITIKNLKAVEIISSVKSHCFYKFIETISEDLPDVCFYGAESGFADPNLDNSSQHYSNVFEENMNSDKCYIDKSFNISYAKEQYVIGGNRVLRNGIVMALYAGEELQIKAECLFGWKIVGKELTVTSVTDDNIVETIDDMPATHIYHKYLNVPNDKNLLRNICEFPLVIQRNGFNIPRIPYICDAQKRLHFGADLKLGEKLRFSYAIPQKIITKAEKTAKSFDEFNPESLCLYVCPSRVMFLRHEKIKDVDQFKHLLPNVSGTMGNSEIFKFRGQGGVLNASLIAVGFKECINCDHTEQAQIIPQTQQNNLSSELPEEEDNSPKYNIGGIETPTMPLSDRLGFFLKAITSELESALDEAKKATNVKSQFLSNMSHEIRTPINTILGMNEMILRESNQSNIREYAFNIQRAGETLLGLINDILDFSKIEAGKLELINNEYELKNVISDLYALLKFRAEQKQLQLKVVIDKNLPSSMVADELRLKQILTNLLTNAIKYTKKGSVTFCIEKKGFSENEVIIHFSVKDTGIGIRGEDIPKLTQAFERIDEIHNRTIEGTGLGLNIVVQLLKQMNSKLEVKSEFGKGSEFSFDLKQVVINKEPIGEFHPETGNLDKNNNTPEHSFIAPDAKILAVDDTSMNLSVIKSLLKRTRIQIDTALSGFDCLKMFEQNHYDLILLDHRMPLMDGIETLHKLKESEKYTQRPIPVIALTANVINGAKELYMKEGFTGYISKPVKPSKLEKILIKQLPKELVTLVDIEQNKAVSENSSLPDWLLKQKLISTSTGIEFCGSENDYFETLKIFANSIDENIAMLDSSLSATDLKSFTIKVHAVKSSARIIGALELSEQAKSLEDLGNKGNLETIRVNYPEFKDMYIKVKDILSSLVDSNEAVVEKQEMSDGDYKNLIENIKMAAESYDYELLSMITATADDYKVKQNKQEYFEKMLNAAKIPDWDLINKYLKELE